MRVGSHKLTGGRECALPPHLGPEGGIRPVGSAYGVAEGEPADQAGDQGSVCAAAVIEFLESLGRRVRDAVVASLGSNLASKSAAAGA